MDRRRLLLSFLPAAWAVALAAAESKPQGSVRGTLHTEADPTIETSSGRRVKLAGDKDTLGVLRDERLNGADFEALGHALDDDRFDVDRIHTRSLFVHRGGKRLMVTYWCDVCYIRTYTPGICWCCQKYTDLDLRESLDDR